MVEDEETIHSLVQSYGLMLSHTTSECCDKESMERVSHAPGLSITEAELGGNAA